MKIEGNAAIVTGGASGLGAATASLLAERGAKVTILDLHVEQGLAHAEKIGAHFTQTDVLSEDQVAEAINAAEDRHGPARILVNCVGIGAPAKIVDRDGAPLPLTEFSKIVSVNLLGTC